MSSSWFVFLPLLIFPLLVGIALWLGVKSARKMRGLMEEMAGRHGLTVHVPPPTLGFLPGTPEVRGTVRGRPVRFYAYSTGSGKSRTQWASVEVEPTAASDFTFRLEAEGFATRVRGWLGTKEVEVGDPAFDKAMFVQTNRPDFLRAALLPELRERLLALGKEAGRQARIELNDGRLRYAEVGHFANEARLRHFEARLEVLSDLASLAEVEAQSHAR